MKRLSLFYKRKNCKQFVEKLTVGKITEVFFKIYLELLSETDRRMRKPLNGPSYINITAAESRDSYYIQKGKGRQAQ